MFAQLERCTLVVFTQEGEDFQTFWLSPASFTPLFLSVPWQSEHSGSPDFLTVQRSNRGAAILKFHAVSGNKIDIVLNNSAGIRN